MDADSGQPYPDQLLLNVGNAEGCNTGLQINHGGRAEVTNLIADTCTRGVFVGSSFGSAGDGAQLAFANCVISFCSGNSYEFDSGKSITITGGSIYQGSSMAGKAAIVLQNCSDVSISGVNIYESKGFGILASGVTNVSLKNLMIVLPAGAGISIVSGTDIVVSGGTISGVQSGPAISVTSGSDICFADLIISRSAGSGVAVAGGSHVSFCNLVIDAAGAGGFVISGGSDISIVGGCVTNVTGGDGIALQPASSASEISITGTVIDSPSGNGISANGNVSDVSLAGVVINKPGASGLVVNGSQHVSWSGGCILNVSNSMDAVSLQGSAVVTINGVVLTGLGAVSNGGNGVHFTKAFSGTAIVSGCSQGAAAYGVLVDADTTGEYNIFGSSFVGNGTASLQDNSTAASVHRRFGNNVIDVPIGKTSLQPQISMTGKSAINGTGFDCHVYAQAASGITSISVGSSMALGISGTTTGGIGVPAGQSITATFTGALSLIWIADN